MPELSGPGWVSQFPASNQVEDLAEPFRTGARNFLSALRNAAATVRIAATLRPPERAYLMHYAFQVSKGSMDPASVPAMAGVDIDWVHRDADGSLDLDASRAAARRMVAAYQIVFGPALSSRHTQGLAIDMDVSWSGMLTITGASGARVAISTAPRTGANKSLQRVGAGYGVFKLATDPPHWSSDGH